MTQLVHYLTKPVDSALLQLPRALIASVLAMCIDVGLLFILVEAGIMPASLAVLLGYLSGCALQYVLCTHWVFPTSGEQPIQGFTVFTLLATVGLAITWLTMQVLHEQIRTPYLAAKVVALGLAFAWNFLSRRHLMYRDQTRVAESA